jgi:hypothetical protein
MDERRGARRQKTFLAGKVIFGANRFVTYCSIRDLSDTGAKLSFADPTEVPNQFELHLASRGTICFADVRWRKGHLVGVKFRAVQRTPLEEARFAEAG